MGILNTTPDSFSDGGLYRSSQAAVDRAVQIVNEGATIIDVGGESTRPGALAVGEAEEMDRILPVIEAIAKRLDVAISVDTSKLAVMAAAVSAGACLVNDVNALRELGAREWAAKAGVGVCLMHRQGEPRSMQIKPEYQDVVSEVQVFLANERRLCLSAGIAPEAIVLDPGIGFGKSQLHNLLLLKELACFTTLGSPVLVGVSRKNFIGNILGRPVSERLFGGLGLAVFAVTQGVKIIRTHDIAATRDALRMVSAVMQA